MALTRQEINAKYKEFLIPSTTTQYPEALPLVKGQGSKVWDADGREYLDFFGGILTVSVGHCNPEVTGPVVEQVQTLQHTSTLFPNPPIVELAEKLATLAPGPLKQSYFTNSGTEANETAVMLAQAHTGRKEILALKHGYHGRTALAQTLVGHSAWRINEPNATPVRHVANAYCYRCPFGQEPGSCGLECAMDVENVIQTTTSGSIAALIGEPIQGVGGFITPPADYWSEVHRIVKKYGGLFISDEVQSGWGRTGGKWFGIEQWGVQPDMMTSAKGIANGAPMGWTITTPEIAASLKGTHVCTFGGNPVSCTAATATLNVIEKHDLRTNAQVVGDYFRGKLEELQQKHPLIGDVRGMGLMQAIELVKDRKTKEPATKETVQVQDRAREHGVILGKGGLYGNVLRITPMLNTTKDEVDVAVAALDKALAEVSKPLALA